MLVDLSHPIEDGRGAYPGLPPPRVAAILDHEASRDRYEGRAEFLLGRVEMSCNTGTYLDAPLHRHRDGEDLATLSLDRLAGLTGAVVDAPDVPGPVSLDLPDDALRGRAVLFRTGRSARWDDDAYWRDGPYLDAGAGQRLVAAGAALVGVDFGNVDDTMDPARPVHTALLGAGIPIVENLRGLDTLPTDGFRFTAVPLAVVGGASFPVRAFAEVP